MNQSSWLSFLVVFFLTVSSICHFQCSPGSSEVELLIHNGKIWTGDDSRPWAQWIGITGNKIQSVGNKGEKNPQAKTKIDLNGNLMVPGFNDSHVHFASAGSLLLGINLLDVNDDSLFVARLKETMQRLPEGSWITGGDWGAYEAWSMGSAGNASQKAIYRPNRRMIDSLSQKYPVLISRYDRKMGLANHTALDLLNIKSEDGILNEEQLKEALGEAPKKSFERKIAEANRALQQCREKGVTTVQDMSPPDRLEVYKKIKEEGELTCRINFSPSRLIEYKDMINNQWIIDWSDPQNPKPAGDEWFVFGTIKTHIDGIMGARTARFYEPYSDNPMDIPNWRGGWREFSSDLPNFKKMILAADKAGIQLRVHAIGDEANSILLDILDSMDVVNGPKDRRFRIVHAQVIADRDFTRFRGKNIVAEVQPYHVTDDMRWMEERIGHQRCQGAYAFNRLEENDCILSFGSDWPGTNASYYPVNPLFGIYAAVTRQTVQGKPADGWFPDQKIPLEKAMKAYTWGSAYGAFEENIKGTIEEGKLADLTVLDTDLFNTSPPEWLEAQVLYTIVGGKIVYQK